LEQPLLHVLIHTDRRAQYPGSYIWDVGQLEQALNRAVFPKSAVQHRKGDVQMADGCAGALGLDELPHCRGRGEQDLAAGPVQRPQPPLGEAPKRGLVEQVPVASPTDADQTPAVRVPIDGLDDAARGTQRNLMLSRASAKDDAAPSFLTWCLHLAHWSRDDIILHRRPHSTTVKTTRLHRVVTCG